MEVLIGGMMIATLMLSLVNAILLVLVIMLIINNSKADKEEQNGLFPMLPSIGGIPIDIDALRKQAEAEEGKIKEAHQGHGQYA